MNSLLIFNNGGGREDGNYSSVDVIAAPFDPRKGYLLEPGTAFGPEQLDWSYKAAEGETFFSSYISGAHRCPNGNTFVCSGSPGRAGMPWTSMSIAWTESGVARLCSRAGHSQSKSRKPDSSRASRIATACTSLSPSAWPPS